LRKQHAIDHPVAVGPDLPDLTVEVPRSPQTPIPDVSHGRMNCSGIAIAESVKELGDGTAAGCGPIVAPAPSRG
jgi:hypothetical protein